MATRLVFLSLVCGAVSVSVGEHLTTSEVPPKRPYFVDCRSPEQETFSCWWSAGDYQNLTGPGALSVFFQKNRDVWRECPDYSTAGENHCYFNSTYTSIWIPYCVQLRSQIQDIVYHQMCFTVDEIVVPDPPVGLNWTLLNISQTGQHFDILIQWEPPPSADVKKGWISLVYEPQYRAINMSDWKPLEVERARYQSVYGLKTGMEYEIRVRCKQAASEKFSEFSDHLYVYIPKVPTKETLFPFTMILIFGAVGVIIVLMLIIFSQQQRLMVYFLPPVPVPKIMGIDPELLKKGKLDELNSILSGHHTFKPELYNDDLWVEFIELDIDDQDGRSHHSDTHKLLGSENLNGNCLNIKDDDSGRASCYEPELPDSDTLDRSQAEAREEKASLLDSEGKAAHSSTTDPSPPGRSHPGATAEGASRSHPQIQSQLSSQSWVNLDFYAQVSNITPAGGVLLSPGQQSKIEKTAEAHSSPKTQKCQLAMTTDSAYTSEMDAKNISATPSLNGNEPKVTVSPYTVSEAPASSVPPVSDYTTVQAVDSQQSLLLNPSTLPTKGTPMPAGYLTPEQLNSIMP